MVKKAQNADQLAEMLRVVTEAVPDLRTAGVTKLQLGDLLLELEPVPLAPATPRRHKDDPDEDFLDPAKYRRRDVPSVDDDDPDDDGGDS
jgi:hypothetical protein